LFDRVAVVATGLLQRVAAFVGEHDEDRAAVVLGADAAGEACLFHSVDDPGEAALAVEDLLGERVHPQALGAVFELDEHVVPAQGDASVAFELRVEHVDERERALEVEPPGAQPLGRRT
jgi:hypothetical protein